MIVSTTLQETLPTSSTLLSNSIRNVSLSDVFSTTALPGMQFNRNVTLSDSFNTMAFAGIKFTKHIDNDTIVRAAFYKFTSFPINASFKSGSFKNVPISANLGSVGRIFNVSGTYRQSSSAKFSAQITIQSTTVVKPPVYSSNLDTRASISIVLVSNKDLLIKANYRVPPISIDLVVTARFAGNVIIQVQNIYTGVITTTKVDSDGFWYVNNLPAGVYSVAPILSQISFDPPIRYVDIANSSPTLYFTELEVADINNPYLGD